MSVNDNFKELTELMEKIEDIAEHTVMNMQMEDILDIVRIHVTNDICNKELNEIEEIYKKLFK